jgi:hypothetical protein
VTAARAAWREADGLGADTIFCWDHFYPLYGEPDGKHFEALTTLASMAEVTERAQIGALDRVARPRQRRLRTSGVIVARLLWPLSASVRSSSASSARMTCVTPASPPTARPQR